MKTKIYKEIAVLLDAIENCKKSNNNEWLNKHTETIEKIMRFAPSGSGIDSGTKFDFTLSSSHKLVFYFSYHFMNENGYYTHWSDYKLIVTPSLAFDINLRIIGSNHKDIKEYLYEIYSIFLTSIYDTEKGTISYE